MKRCSFHGSLAAVQSIQRKQVLFILSASEKEERSRAKLQKTPHKQSRMPPSCPCKRGHQRFIKSPSPVNSPLLIENFVAPLLHIIFTHPARVHVIVEIKPVIPEMLLMIPLVRPASLSIAALETSEKAWHSAFALRRTGWPLVSAAKLGDGANENLQIRNGLRKNLLDSLLSCLQVVVPVDAILENAQPVVTSLIFDVSGEVDGPDMGDC